MTSPVSPNRKWAMKVIGLDAIYRIEQYEFQAPGYGSDDEYDTRKEAL